MQSEDNLKILSKAKGVTTLTKRYKKLQSPIRTKKNTEKVTKNSISNNFPEPNINQTSISKGKAYFIPKIDINFTPKDPSRETPSRSPIVSKRLHQNSSKENNKKIKERITVNNLNLFRDIYMLRFANIKPNYPPINSLRIKLDPLLKSFTPEPR